MEGLTLATPAAASAAAGAKAEGPHGTLAQLLAMEWTKLRSLPSTLWILLSCAAAAVVVATLQALELRSGTDAGELAQVGSGSAVGLMNLAANLAPMFTVALGALAITGEHASGMVRTTLVAAPQRGRLLAAKALVLAAVTWVFGVAVTMACWLVGGVLLGGFGTAGVTARAAAAGATWIMAAKVLAFGFGTVLRSTAGAVVLSLGLILVASSLVVAVSEDLAARIVPYMPEDASAVLLTGAGSLLPAAYGQWAAVAVLGGWVAAALLAGYRELRRRDP